MIKIDVENLLSAKQAKELSVSLNLFVNATKKQLIQKCKGEFLYSQFKVEYDNGDVFRIFAQTDTIGKTQSFVEYEKRTGELMQVISLQDALNINKYVRDFEQIVKHRDINDNVFRGYYTEQSIDKKIAIYNESDAQQRYAERDEDIFFTTVNENYDIDQEVEESKYNRNTIEYDDLEL